MLLEEGLDFGTDHPEVILETNGGEEIAGLLSDPLLCSIIFQSIPGGCAMYFLGLKEQTQTTVVGFCQEGGALGSVFQDP